MKYFIETMYRADFSALRAKFKYLTLLSKKELINLTEYFKEWDTEIIKDKTYTIYRFSYDNVSFICLGR